MSQISTNTQHRQLWVDPLDTEPLIDWKCSCLKGAPCLPESEKWFECDRNERQKPLDSRDNMKCYDAMVAMIECNEKAKASKSE